MKKTLCLALILCLLLLCLPAAAMAYDVVLSPQKLTVDGQYVECEKYNIDGSNYFKLRDLAFLLMGTDAEFGVGYDPEANSVIIVPGMPYEPVGGELVIGEDKSATAVPSSQSVWFLDAPVDGLSIYNIGGNNYFKLRDLGTALGFLVDYDADTNTAIVETSGYADAPLGNANQIVAVMTLYDWVEANYNDVVGGDKEYYETIEYDDGDAADYEMVATELGGEKMVVLIATYYYADGTADVTWIFLDADDWAYYVSYDYYAADNLDMEEADFTGDVDLNPATFVGYEDLVFDSVDGALADYAEEFGGMATLGISDTLNWLDDLMRGTPELSGSISLLDLRFTYAALEA